MGKLEMSLEGGWELGVGEGDVCFPCGSKRPGDCGKLATSAEKAFKRRV